MNFRQTGRLSARMLEPDEAAIEIINFPVEISKGEPEIYYFALIVRAGYGISWN